MSPSSAPVRRTRQRFILIGLLFFHSMNTIMDRVCISAAKDGIIADLKITDQMMGYIFGIFALGYALFQIPSGWFADRAGPRVALTWIVGVWSTFTMLTGAAFNAASMLVLRFLFGAGEAGAFPGAARAFYSWLPVQERGVGHGINFSGSRIGAAIALFTMPVLIEWIGWRMTFVVNGLIGVFWAVAWLWWFRDKPQDNPRVSAAELEHIQSENATEPNRKEAVAGNEGLGFILVSPSMLLAMFQYFASNMTFFICFSWLLPFMTEKWGSGASVYAPLPLLVGAGANWVSGGLITWIYRKGYHVGSRRIPAILGFALGTVGLLGATQFDDIVPFILCFSVAIFGVDLTLSPSWSLCNDIGKSRSGVVSASMNMAGNIGSAVSSILFPFFIANVSFPLFNATPGSANGFFVFCAAINALAIVAWLGINPKRAINTQLTRGQVRWRLIAGGLLLFGSCVGLISFSLFRS